MGQRATPPVRLSVRHASWELKESEASIKRGMKQMGFTPGDDQKYSLYQITQALYSNNGLAEKGQAARWESKIADAELKKLRIKTESKELIPTDKFRQEWDDVVTTLFTRIRHAPFLNEKQKRDLIAGIEADFEKRFV